MAIAKTVGITMRVTPSLKKKLKSIAKRKKVKFLAFLVSALEKVR